MQGHTKEFYCITTYRGNFLLAHSVWLFILFLFNRGGWNYFPSSGCYGNDTLTFFFTRYFSEWFSEYYWMNEGNYYSSPPLRSSLNAVWKKSGKLDNQVDILWPSPDSAKEIEYRQLKIIDFSKATLKKNNWAKGKYATAMF